MNTLNKIFSAAATAVVLLSANAAYADTTRDQVIAELAQARASGALASLNSEDSARFLQTQAAGSTSRAQVVAQLNGKAVTTSADTGMFVDTPKTSTKTRAQVIAELKASQADGTFALLHSDDPTNLTRLAEIQRAKASTAMAE